MAHCMHYTAHRLALGEHLKILCEGRRSMYRLQKWHLRCKTSDVSETKQSAKLTTECTYMAYRLVTNLVT